MIDSPETANQTPGISEVNSGQSVGTSGPVPGVMTASIITPDQKLQFLYKVIDDTQGITRFLDAKAAFAVALLSAMTGKVLSDLPYYFPLGSQPLWRKAILYLFWTLALMTGFVVFRAIFPVSNPRKNINAIPDECKPQFFVWRFDPKSWMRIWSSAPQFSTMALSQREFVNDIESATTGGLVTSLAAEVLKVSYIRQIKADRLRTAGILLFVSSILFVLLIVAQSLDPRIADPAKIKVEGTVEIHDKAEDEDSRSHNEPSAITPSTTPGPRTKARQKFADSQ
jgi:hypothetical protein